MDIVIINDLPYPVMITVVEHHALSLEFVISTARVPIPMGNPLRRETLDPGQVLAVQNLPDNAHPTMVKRQFPGDVRIRRRWGTAKRGKKDVKFVEVTLCDPSDAGPEEP